MIIGRLCIVLLLLLSSAADATERFPESWIGDWQGKLVIESLEGIPGGQLEVYSRPLDIRLRVSKSGRYTMFIRSRRGSWDSISRFGPELVERGAGFTLSGQRRGSGQRPDEYGVALDRRLARSTRGCFESLVVNLSRNGNGKVQAVLSFAVSPYRVCGYSGQGWGINAWSLDAAGELTTAGGG